MRHDVFVSYSQPDRECAMQLVARLEASEFAVWIAPRDISPAADWAAEIIDAIAASRIMVLVFSAHSNTSAQVRREVERAVHKQVPVLPFRIEDVLPSRSLEYFLSAQHWLDAFPPPLEAHYARLCAHLAPLLNRSASAATAEPERAQPLTHTHATARIALSESSLAALQGCLANHIGPVAKYLVRRVAANVSEWDQLVSQLAAEIDSVPARKQFLEKCRRLPRAG